MKILLLTDVPPCTNYTAGIVLGQIIKVLPKGSVSTFCVLNPDLQNIEADPELAHMPLEYAPKPREMAFPGTGLTREIKSHLAEEFRIRAALPRLVDQIAEFAKRERCDTVWAVLQGQTMVRLAGRVAKRLKAPLFTLVWDPLDWWLKSNQVDRWSAKKALKEFDDTIRASKAVATASHAMTEEFRRLYGTRGVALMASHPKENSYKLPGRPHKDGKLVIGMAGQFYAWVEWQTLIKTLNDQNWKIGGREIYLKVCGHYMLEQANIPADRVDFKGWQSQHDTLRILAKEADVLYCPYPFDPSMREVSRLSFPGKLIAYFAAGRPVLFHGPVESSPGQYLLQHDAGVVTTGSGPSNVFNALERLASDEQYFADRAASSQRVFAAEFTLDTMRERALEFFETTEQALAAAPPANTPFNPHSPAARLPPPRIEHRPRRRAARALVAAVRTTPLRAPIDLAFRTKHKLQTKRASLRTRVAERFPFTIGQRHARNQIVGGVHVAIAETRAVAGEVAALRQELISRISDLDAQRHESLRQKVETLELQLLEFEGSKRVLAEQLQGSMRAYESLAAHHSFLNQRFDSVASAALAKLDALSLNASRAAAPSSAGQVGADKYLDLLEAVLTGSLTDDPNMGPWAKEGYSSDARLLGRDWPQTALSMIGRTRMRNVRVLLEQVIRDGIPGDMIETGVWRGGACIYMRAILDAYSIADRTVWVADSFRGLPPPDAEAFPVDAGDTHFTLTDLQVSSDQVRANFARFNLLDDQVKFLEGWFKDTLPSAPIEKLALLRLDGDMYESTWQALEALYHKVSPGGFIIVDDYILAGCAKAVDDWRVREKITAPLQEIDGAAVFWQKV
jgi:glycosyltransferase involved in cell wall biosynthesis